MRTSSRALLAALAVAMTLPSSALAADPVVDEKFDAGVLPAGCPRGPVSPQGPKGEKGDTLDVRVTCDLAGDGRSITCTIKTIAPTATFKGTARLQGTKSAKPVKGTGQAKFRLKSAKRLRKAPKVVLTLKSGSRSKAVTVRAR